MAQRDGVSASRIHNAINPLRVIYRRALDLGDVAINPCEGLRLPAENGKRERFANPDEAADLITALPERQRPFWATAFYTGLRIGELQALDCVHVDLKADVIRVERSWDRKAGFVEAKSKAGRRTHDRCRGQREGPIDVHGAREHHITMDRYGHLLPGNEAEAAELLDAYLDDHAQASSD